MKTKNFNMNTIKMKTLLINQLNSSNEKSLNKHRMKKL